mmetsp:Transcript_18537/g.45626  ORF Transcript_18537/g.45626 Transcript_18537/m.45626 type:complete len:272 (+) Transcript_18537:1432-2247(+)
MPIFTYSWNLTRDARLPPPTITTTLPRSAIACERAIMVEIHGRTAAPRWCVIVSRRSNSVSESWSCTRSTCGVTSAPASASTKSTEITSERASRTDRPSMVRATSVSAFSTSSCTRRASLFTVSIMRVACTSSSATPHCRSTWMSVSGSDAPTLTGYLALPTTATVLLTTGAPVESHTDSARTTNESSTGGAGLAGRRSSSSGSASNAACSVSSACGFRWCTMGAMRSVTMRCDGMVCRNSSTSTELPSGSVGSSAHTPSTSASNAVSMSK